MQLPLGTISRSVRQIVCSAQVHTHRRSARCAEQTIDAVDKLADRPRAGGACSTGCMSGRRPIRRARPFRFRLERRATVAIAFGQSTQPRLEQHYLRLLIAAHASWSPTSVLLRLIRSFLLPHTFPCERLARMRLRQTGHSVTKLFQQSWEGGPAGSLCCWFAASSYLTRLRKPWHRSRTQEPYATR